MRVAIIDYGSGNLRSAAKAFERVAADVPSASILVTTDPEIVRRADRLVLPGVGAFGDCRAGLAALPGMIEAMTEAVLQRGRPFLGICVGMQLLATWGREHGDHPGLGWIPGEVVALRPSDLRLKIPHMGWNGLIFPSKRHPVLAGVAQGETAYFVHSYHFAGAPDWIVAEVEHGETLAAVIAKDTVVGTQFHPEKSQETGLRVISNFLTWTP